MADKTWSVPASRRLLLGSWVSGNCAVELVGFDLAAEDTFSAYSVSQEAQILIEECVTGRIKIGGRKTIGSKGLFRVIVWHEDYRRPLVLGIL